MRRGEIESTMAGIPLALLLVGSALADSPGSTTKCPADTYDTGDGTSTPCAPGNASRGRLSNLDE